LIRTPSRLAATLINLRRENNDGYVKEMMIMNTAESPGIHWVLVMLDHRRRVAVILEPFGRDHKLKATLSLAPIFRALDWTVKIEWMGQQAPDDGSSCGYVVLDWVTSDGRSNIGPLKMETRTKANGATGDGGKYISEEDGAAESSKWGQSGLGPGR